LRLNNLETLIAEAGSATKLAQLAGTSESYISQVRRKMRTAKGTPRGLGDELAGKLENGMGKPRGWMDEPHHVVERTLNRPVTARAGNLLTLSGEENVPPQPLDHEPSSENVDDHGRFKSSTVSAAQEGKDASASPKLGESPLFRTSELLKKGTKRSQKDPARAMAYADVITLCPLINWEQAVARSLAESQRHRRGAESLLPCPVACSPHTFVLRVKGASMEPKFASGELIFVDPMVAVESGNYVVVQIADSDEADFKQLIIEGGRQYLKAMNPDWPNRIIEIEETATVCGVVVFKGEVM